MVGLMNFALPNVVQSILCVFNCYNGSIRSFIINMAKAVTLKNNNDEEVYPVTDLSLVNGDIPTGRRSREWHGSPCADF